MKVLLPVEGIENDSTICPSFARAPFYLIHNTETQTNHFYENSAVNAPGGAGVKAAQQVLAYEVDSVLTPRLGNNSAEVLLVAKVQLFKTIGSNALDNIEAFKRGELKALEHFHEGFHHHGGKA